ncbi:MAG: hypothetical protein ACR2FI_03240 [Burkholderiales bacterium]|nr:hypothetical protein [Burkholderiales bacterium]MDQ3195512.1 hypothetical protein [Pseudomonadota bacterium]
MPRAIPGCLLILLLGVSACVPQAQKSMPATQVIIKFSDAVRQPDAPEFVARLARDTGAGMQYVRPMSGDAHVYRINGIRDDAHLRGVLASISERNDVVYAEADKKMQAMPGKGEK